MDNRNMPSNSELTHERCGGASQSKTSGGLTKLEYAAISAMQGLLSYGILTEDNRTLEDIGLVAVSTASALFDELEKSND